MKTVRFVACLVAMLGFCIVAGAGHIEVVSVIDTSAAPDPLYDWENLINDSGMSGDTRTLADTHGQGAQGDGMGLSNNYPGANLVFDLGTDYSLDDMWIWNYSDHGPTTVFGMKNVQIYIQADGGEDVAAGYIEIGQHDGTDASPVNIIYDFEGAMARYVKFFTAGFPDHNWSGGVYNFCGLAEVRFYSDSITSCEQAIGGGYGLTGDVNRDCHVDLNDLSAFSQAWLTCMDPETEDPNACLHPWEP